MPETFNFCPDTNVPETLPPDVGSGFTSTTGWNFSSKPTSPYQRRFKVRLHGLTWRLNAATGLYDSNTSTSTNARALELFYAQHQTWLPFTFPHQHLGNLLCRFASPVSVPAARERSNGLVDAFEITLIEHNPGY